MTLDTIHLIVSDDAAPEVSQHAAQAGGGHTPAVAGGHAPPSLLRLQVRVKSKQSQQA